MVIIDFSDTPKKAFMRGFLKGLTAPALLFETHYLPEKKKIKPIPMPSIQDAQALTNDWAAVGNDFYKVIERHDKKITGAATTR